MAVRTEAELTDHLDRDLAWRKRELSTLRLAIRVARNHEQTVLLRGAVCILYAHWEGFIKTSAQAYLQFVTARRPKYNELKRNFLVLGVRDWLKNAKEVRSASFGAELLSFALDSGNRTIPVSIVRSIDTMSNLNSTAFIDILNTVGFDTAGYVERRTLLDERLLKNRNSIAHGQYVDIEEENYSDLSTDVLGLMERFKNDIQNAAATKSYRV